MRTFQMVYSLYGFIYLTMECTECMKGSEVVEVSELAADAPAEVGVKFWPQISWLLVCMKTCWVSLSLNLNMLLLCSVISAPLLTAK